MNKKNFLLNAFSLQMIDFPAKIKVEEVSRVQVPFDFLESAIGHADTAAVLGVPCNRINVHLEHGDVAYVAQLIGGRLPEGSTTLPEGFSFKFLRIQID